MILDNEGNLENFLESQRPSRNNDNSDNNSNHDNDNGDADVTLDDGVIDDLPPSASITDLVRRIKEIGMI